MGVVNILKNNFNRTNIYNHIDEGSRVVANRTGLIIKIETVVRKFSQTKKNSNFKKNCKIK